MELRENGERAKAAQIVFYVMFGVLLLMLISEFMQYSLLSNANYTDEEANANDLRQQILAVAYLFIFITGIVFFLRWFRRAYYNLHQLNVYPNYTEGWAVGAWFTPITNLFRPYSIMKEIWQHTQEKAKVSIVESRTILKLWWIIFIIGNIIGNISARLSVSAISIEDLQMVTVLNIVSHGLEILALWLIIQIIKKIAIWEKIVYNGESEMAIEDHLLSID